MISLTPKIVKWSIYKITSPSGRVYIGKTSNLKRRIRCYASSDCKSQPLLFRSLKKYGFESHKFEVVDNFESDLSYANGKEITWIKAMMSQFNKFSEMRGMNLCAGGRGTIGRKKSEEERKAISIKNKGYKHTDEAKAKIGKASKGNRHLLGRKLSEETKLKMSQSQKGKTRKKGYKHTPEWSAMMRERKIGSKDSMEVRAIKRKAQRKSVGVKIDQFTLNNKYIRSFDSMAEAAEITGIKRFNIKNSVKRGHPTYGFYFKRHPK